MGLRFYRRVRLFPGVRINLSRSGISTSIGVRGAHVTVGHGKVRETVGLPGTGISYTETQTTAHATPEASGEPLQASAQSPEDPSRVVRRGHVGVLLLLVAIFAFVVWRAVAG
jgi:hypothetical protein